MQFKLSDRTFKNPLAELIYGRDRERTRKGWFLERLFKNQVDAEWIASMKEARGLIGLHGWAQRMLDPEAAVEVYACMVRWDYETMMSVYEECWTGAYGAALRDYLSDEPETMVDPDVLSPMGLHLDYTLTPDEWAQKILEFYPNRYDRIDYLELIEKMHGMVVPRYFQSIYRIIDRALEPQGTVIDNEQDNASQGGQVNYEF